MTNRMLSDDEIENRFGFHKAAIEGPNATAELHAEIRRKFKALARDLDEMVFDGRAKSIAFNELETASMWFHKALASHSELEPDEPFEFTVKDFCETHDPVQHRDGKPPWCRACGLTKNGTTPTSFPRKTDG